MARTISPQLMRQAMVAAGLGGLFGYHVTPHLMGYEDVKPARRQSATIDALLFASLPFIASAAGGRPGQAANLSKFVKQRIMTHPKQTMGVPAALLGGEILPVTTAAVTQGSDAAKALARSAPTVSIPYNLKQFLQSGTARGAAAGSAVAGLGALGTGLMRRPTRQEHMQDTTRPQMVGKDFLKWLVPALVAGGIAGSFQNQ